MEVKPGYKLTEAGVIPQDWDTCDISDLCVLQRGFDITEATRKPGEVPVYSSSGISYFHSEAKLNPPSVITGRKGILGKVFYIEKPCWAHDTTLWVKDFKQNYPKFVYFYLIYFKLERFDAATSVPTLNRNNLVDILIPLPPLPEQQAIAAALSDVDALLHAQDTLIAKKRDIKQAAMQQLLTGKQRLPGFSGAWEMKRLGDLAVPRNERVNPKQSGSLNFCIEMEHIEQQTGCLIGSTTTKEQASLKTVFYSGDVLFGKLRAYLRKYWLADCQGVCSTEIWALVPNIRLITSKFLFQLVKTDGFIEVASTAYGTHMPRSDWNVVKNFEVFLPNIEEQKAIAAVLSDMDAEIAALEQKRDKTRALKQGMMQELLTGKTRLL